MHLIKCIFFINATNYFSLEFYGILRKEIRIDIAQRNITIIRFLIARVNYAQLTE